MRLKSNTILLLGILLFAFTVKASAQQAMKKTLSNTYSVAFWNVENLYDTINDPLTDDEEFLPNGKNSWNTKRYTEKLSHLSEVIAQLGDKNLKQAPSILGLAEIENKTVLNDLVKQPLLKKYNYQIVHFDGPDKRGVDVALVYNPKHFEVTSTARYVLNSSADSSFATREQLVVSGKLNGTSIHLIVAHWPSRRGGAESNEKRVAAATLGRKIIDSLQLINANSAIIYMGDLNDDPKDESVEKVMNAKADVAEKSTGFLYNPMAVIHKPSVGTLCYKENWNLFDQTLISLPLADPTHPIHFLSVHIFNDDMVREKDGKYKGQPYRSYAGAKYLGGYSDHFAVYIILAKKNRKKGKHPIADKGGNW